MRNQRRKLAADHEQAKANLEASARELAGLRAQEVEVRQQVLQVRQRDLYIQKSCLYIQKKGLYIQTRDLCMGRKRPSSTVDGSKVAPLHRKKGSCTGKRAL